MRIIIGGAGRIGFELARTLRLQNHDVVLIDFDSRAIKRAQQLDALIINGDITARAVLQEAGINTARVFIATTESDEINLIASMLAEHEHNLTDKNNELLSIVRVKNKKYVKEQSTGQLVEWAKVNYVVDPTQIMIERLHAGLTSGIADQVIHFGHSAYILEIEIATTASHLVGKTNHDIKENSDVEMPPILAIKKPNGRMTLYDSKYRYEVGDTLAVSVAGLDKLTYLMTLFGHEVIPYPEVPKVVIFGASDMGTKIANDWLTHGARVTVIERDIHLANKLVASDTGMHQHIEVIHGDHLDKTILSEISIENFDFAISALSDDHDNIAACLLANDMGVTRTGLFLFDSDLIRVTKRMGITFAVDRSQVAVDQILNIIHTKSSGSYGKLNSITDFVGISASISEDSKMAGMSIEDLKKFDWLRVAFIQRRNLSGEWESFAPREKKAIIEGDRLIIFTDHAKSNDIQKKI